MLFSKALAGLALLSFSATTMASPTPVDWAAIQQTSLTKRATSLVNIPACVEINLADDISISAALSQAAGDGLGIVLQPVLDTLLGGTLDPVLESLGSVCICLEIDAVSGQPTGTLPDLAQIQTKVSGSGVLGLVAFLLDDVIDILQPIVFDLIKNRRQGLADNCTAPIGGTLVFPSCSTSTACPPPTCPTSLPQYCAVRNECLAADAPCCSGDQVLCGTTCVAPETPCTSGIPGRKRSIKERSRYACRQPLTACPVSHFLARDGSSVAGRGFECLDTRANIESCGGCITPFKGNTAGQDCTAIAHADSVACAAGTCIVESCFAGFTPSGDRSACVASLNSAGFAVQGRK